MRKGIWSAAVAVVVLVSATGVLWGVPALADSRVSMVDSDSDALKWHFDPADVSVAVGSTVVWHNGGKQTHTVTADDGKSFSSPNVPEGGDFQFKFTTPGDFAYHCDPHPWMKAVVHVTGASTPTTAGTTTTTSPAAGASTSSTTAATREGASTSSTTTTTAAGGATTTTLAPAVTPTSAPDSASSTTTTTAAGGQPSEEGAEGAPGHSKTDKSSPVGIAFAAVSTLLLAAVSAKLLASKP